MAEGPGGDEPLKPAANTKLAALPERFVALDDVVAQELADLDFPWNLKAIEERIGEYTAFSESINAQLSARVMQNYNEFVQGMQQVQAVETELTLIGVLIKNGRRKLQERDTGLLRGGMAITRQRRKRERLRNLLGMLDGLQGVVSLEGQLRSCLHGQSFCEAIGHNAELRQRLSTEHFRQFAGLAGLRGSLSENLVLVQQRLGDGLRVAAVSSDFDAGRYEEILRAYSMMGPDPASLSVGKELLRHVSECIVAVSRQCALAFSAAPSHEAASDWHRKAQLRDLCRSMDPVHFVACTAQLYAHLCDFLYRHQFLCAWHVEREKKAADDGENSSGFREVLREVLAELTSSKRAVWDRVQQQVSLVLMTLEFQYPALNEESFLHILHLTQMLIEEGDAFIADWAAGRSVGSAEARRTQFSAPMRNTLKSKAHDYFQSLHFHAWASFKAAYVEQDSWQRLPVPRSYALIRSDRLKAALPSRERRGAEGNPFRNYKPEPLTHEPAREDNLVQEQPEELDEHALLRHWINDSESMPHEQIGSSLLSNSNCSPVVSTSTTELARVLERYFRMMAAMPQLALDVFQSAMQLFEFYVYSVLRLFVQDKHLRLLLEDLEAPMAPADPKLPARQEAFLAQQLFPDLRRAASRTREFVSALALPDQCAASLNLQPPATGAALLQLMPFPKLSSPGSLCGLSERCVGVESVASLLADLGRLKPWLSALLPRGPSQDNVERFVAHQETVSAQLRGYVLACAAKDILEVPDVGRVSLEHFSNTVQGLRWEASSFPSGSPATPYLEQQRNQIDELARRIPCAGGGSIPFGTQRLIWAWMEVRVMQECAEVLGKTGRRKSQEALCILAEDFNVMRTSVHENQVFKEASSEEPPPLLAADHPLAGTVQWAYLEQYLQAHGYLASEALAWCKKHPEYPLRLQRALLEYVNGGNQKAARQQVTEYEAFLVDFIADKSASFSQRGL